MKKVIQPNLAAGIILILTPLINLFATYFFSGADAASGFKYFFKYLAQIYPSEWVWLTLLLVSGVLILLKRRVAKLIVLITLSAILFLNIIKILKISQESNYNIIIILIAQTLATTLSLYYVYKFTSYNRRGGWSLLPEERISTNINCKIEFRNHDNPVEFQIDSISKGGFHGILSEDIDSANTAPESLNYLDLGLLSPQLSKLPFKIIECKNKSLRAQFENLNYDQNFDLKIQLKKLKSEIEAIFKN
jgi:hypothetical protein